MGIDWRTRVVLPFFLTAGSCSLDFSDPGFGVSVLFSSPFKDACVARTTIDLHAAIHSFRALLVSVPLRQLWQQPGHIHHFPQARRMRHKSAFTFPVFLTARYGAPVAGTPSFRFRRCPGVWCVEFPRGRKRANTRTVGENQWYHFGVGVTTHFSLF